FSFLWRSYVPSWAPEFAGVAHGVSSGIRRRGARRVARWELRNPQPRRTVGATEFATVSQGVSRSGISGNSRVAQHVGSGIRMPTPR
ncbi:unnamed protein product, partial [Closterium sp. NIES-65]